MKNRKHSVIIETTDKYKDTKESDHPELLQRWLERDKSIISIFSFSTRL